MPGRPRGLRTRRRTFLKAASVTALAATAGCPGDGSDDPSTPTPSRNGSAPTSTAVDRSGSAAVPTDDYADRFETVVDVVSAGADPDGNRLINDVVQEHANDDTLLVFPDGTYRLEPIELSLPKNVGLVAASGAEPALRPGDVSPSTEWLTFTDASGFVVDGIDFEYRDLDAMGGTTIHGPGPITIRGLEVRGEYRTIDEQLMRIDVTDADGAALVEDVVARGVDERGVNTTGLYVGRDHAGEITFRNCRLDRFSDNALYASPPGGEGGAFEGADGAVHVRGGTFRNNNIAAIRLGSTGSTVAGATVVVDEPPPSIDESANNARGIRLRGQRGQRVENCRLVYGPDAGNASGAIAIHGANGNATIRNVTVEMNRDGVRAILAKEPTVDGDVAPIFENVTVSGTAAREQTVSITGRPGARFRNCCIRQSGPDRDGIELVDSPDCSLEGSQIDVSGEPVVLRNSPLESAYTPGEVCSDAQ